MTTNQTTSRQTQACLNCSGTGRGYFDFDIDGEVTCPSCQGTGRKQTAVAAKPEAKIGASEKQVAFLAKLADEYRTLTMATIDETGRMADYNGKPITEYVAEAIDKAVAEALESKRGASKLIDSLLDANRRLREDARIRQYEADKLAQAERKAQRASGQRNEADVDGMYQLPDGRIVKVQYAVHGSGKPYAKLVTVHEGHVEFEYTPGLVRECKPEYRMTLDQAKAFGALYGACCNCGKTLTDERSIEAGIGPVCARKFA